MFSNSAQMWVCSGNNPTFVWRRGLNLCIENSNTSIEIIHHAISSTEAEVFYRYVLLITDNWLVNRLSGPALRWLWTHGFPISLYLSDVTTVSVYHFWSTHRCSWVIIVSFWGHHFYWFSKSSDSISSVLNSTRFISFYSLYRPF